MRSKRKVNFISILNSLSKNYKLSIYTSKTHERVEKILDLFFKSVNFDSVLASDDVLHPKPNPDGLIKICELVNSTIEETIYIGDTIYDLEASREAEVDFVYASWGYGEVKNFNFQDNFPIPHVGWNEVKTSTDQIFKDLPKNFLMYFNHSYFFTFF